MFCSRGLSSSKRGKRGRKGEKERERRKEKERKQEKEKRASEREHVLKLNRASKKKFKGVFFMLLDMQYITIAREQRRREKRKNERE